MSGRNVFGLVLISILGTAFVIVGVVGRVGAGSTYQYLFGTIGLLPFAAAIISTTMLFVGARHAEKALRQAQIAEIGSRFQKGVELTSDASTTSSIGGIAILRDIAEESPERYFAATTLTLLAKISETDRAAKSTFRYYNAGKTGDPVFSRSDRSTGRVLSTFSSLNPFPRRWPAGVILNEDRATVQDIYITDTLREDDNFARMSLLNFFCSRMTFRRCTFSEAILTMHVGPGVWFENCNFQGAKLFFYEENMRTRDPTVAKRIRLTDCDLRDATINGADALEWLSAHSDGETTA